MLQQVSRRLSYANVVSTLGLFIALSGTAYAVNGSLAGRTTVGSADIINGEVKTPDLAGGAVTGAKVTDDTLTGADVDESTLGLNASTLIRDTGPLPRESTFTTKGGKVLLSVSGSGYRGPARSGGRIGMRVLVDGVDQGNVSLYANELFSHKAFVADDFILSNLQAGTHTIRLEALYDGTFCNLGLEDPSDYCTSTDLNDFFNVSATEIPK